MSMQNFDPMDTNYTESQNIDLTKRPPKQDEQPVIDGPKTPEFSSLAEMRGETPTNTIPSEDNTHPITKIKKVEAVNIPMDSKRVEEFDPAEIIPKKEKPADPGVNEIFGALDMAVAREKKSISDRHKDLEEKMYEDYISHEADSVEETTAKPATVINHDDPDLYNDEENYASTKEPKDEPVKNYRSNFIPTPENNVGKDEEESSKPEQIQVKLTIQKSADGNHTDINPIEEDEDDEIDPDEKRKAMEKKEEKELDDLVEGIKAAAKCHFSPSFSGIDLSKFSISNHGVKASSVVLRTPVEASVADWILYESGYPISMSGLSGPELIKLDPENSTRNRPNTIKDIYRIIYDHVVDTRKPGFIPWMKQTKYSDIDHIYFALYKATFANSNSISYQCPDCKNIFIKDVPFDEMVKYKDDSVKKRVEEILQQDTNIGTIKYDVDLVQASDNYVFGMRSPSLYNIVIENASLPDALINKDPDMVNTIAYIDSVYTIDYTNMNLIPVIMPEVKDDPVKTAIKRVKILLDILNKLTSDQYFILKGYISKVIDHSSEVSYCIPATICPAEKCGAEIKENTNIDANSLLFTRHRLGAFANM